MAGMPRRQALLMVAAIALLVAVLDQATKAWARGSLTPGHEVTIIPGWLWFRLASNSGATLGLGTGNNALFAVLALVILGAIVMLALRGNAGGVLGLGKASVLIHHLGQQRAVERSPVDADPHRAVVFNRGLDHGAKVIVMLLADIHVARIDAVLGQRLRASGIFLQE